MSAASASRPAGTDSGAGQVCPLVQPAAPSRRQPARETRDRIGVYVIRHALDRVYYYVGESHSLLHADPAFPALGRLHRRHDLRPRRRRGRRQPPRRALTRGVRAQIELIVALAPIDNSHHQLGEDDLDDDFDPSELEDDW